MYCICRYWQIALDGAVVGSSGIGLTATVAILDTGSSAITVGQTDGGSIHAVGY